MTAITEVKRCDKTVRSTRVPNNLLPVEWARDTAYAWTMSAATTAYVFDTRGPKFNGGWTVACAEATHEPIAVCRTKAEAIEMLENNGRCYECARTQAREVLNELIERNTDWLENADWTEDLNNGGYCTWGGGKDTGGVSMKFGFGVMTGGLSSPWYRGVNEYRAKAQVVVINGKHTFEYLPEYDKDGIIFETLDCIRDHAREELAGRIDAHRARLVECNTVCRDALNALNA